MPFRSTFFGWRASLSSVETALRSLRPLVFVLDCKIIKKNWNHQIFWQKSDVFRWFFVRYADLKRLRKVWKHPFGYEITYPFHSMYQRCDFLCWYNWLQRYCFFFWTVQVLSCIFCPKNAFGDRKHDFGAQKRTHTGVQVRCLEVGEEVTRCNPRSHGSGQHRECSKRNDMCPW